MEFLSDTILLCAKVFDLQYNFWGEFLYFFQRIRDQRKILLFMTHLLNFSKKCFVCSYSHFLLTLKPNAGIQLNETENLFFKCILESRRLHFNRKGKNRCTLSARSGVVGIFPPICVWVGEKRSSPDLNKSCYSAQTSTNQSQVNGEKIPLKSWRFCVYE